MSVFAWIVTAVSLVAVVLNIRKCALCFFLWAFTNSAWAWLDFERGLVAQGVLQTIYFGLSVYGLWRWGIRDRRSGAHPTRGENHEKSRSA